MIELENITAHLGQFTLHPTSLRVPTGHYCVLLGPPGSGKTTLVELICGLRPLLGGRILLDGRAVEAMDPADRHVGYVPQDYALFPTLSVRRNIAFGLEVRHVGRTLVHARVEQAAARLHIEYLLDRSCRGLSGGERQRVALARALVLEPKVLLLDEPVSALDESTRQQVCLELRSLHQSLGMTTVHICHNFEETRSVADLVGVINEGRLVQSGTVEEIFRTPATEFVARFVQAGSLLQAPAGGEQAKVLLRPQDAALLAKDQPVPAGKTAIPGTVASVQDDGGFQVTARVAIAPQQFVSVALLKLDDQPIKWRLGDRVQVVFDPKRLHPLKKD
ncbi:MAG: ABC transporter ATP-binding protein [Phycisphaerae bacterium]|nr:ABC transporter ATP-binding protein [Phycisphaerae bacterium]